MTNIAWKVVNEAKSVSDRLLNVSNRTADSPDDLGVDFELFTGAGARLRSPINFISWQGARFARKGEHPLTFPSAPARADGLHYSRRATVIIPFFRLEVRFNFKRVARPLRRVTDPCVTLSFFRERFARRRQPGCRIFIRILCTYLAFLAVPCAPRNRPLSYIRRVARDRMNRVHNKQPSFFLIFLFHLRDYATWNSLLPSPCVIAFVDAYRIRNYVTVFRFLNVS